MPPTASISSNDTDVTRDALDRAADEFEDFDPDHQLREESSPDSQLLGPFTVICLFLNRTIGSGIFTSPAIVLHSTRSVGGSLLTWAAGGIVSFCMLGVWLELCLSVPTYTDPSTGQTRHVARSGGEKNIIEYIFKKPRYLATCSYGYLFIVFGTLAGNAILLARYLLQAANHQISGTSDPTINWEGSVTGIAIAVTTLPVAIHMFSRRGGIILNNIFAVLKVCLLVVIIILAFVYAYKNSSTSLDGTLERNATEIAQIISQNYGINNSFKTPNGEQSADGASALTSVLYVLYSFSGFMQPFYVLAEVLKPRKNLPKSMTIAMIITIVLFMFQNVAYWLVLPASEYVLGPDDPVNTNLPTIFFQTILGEDLGPKVLNSALTFSIFGNLLVMTYSSGRVKQEIAKEGVLPFSRFFAKMDITPFAWIQQRFRSGQKLPPTEEDRLEQAPITGLLLHWISTTVTILAVSMLRSDLAATALITVYGYVILLLVTMVVSGGLIYLKLRKSSNWKDICNFRPWLDPLPVVVSFSVATAVFVAGFSHPRIQINPSLNWYILPTIALSSPLWGGLWWLCLLLIQKVRRERLETIRIPFVVDQDGEWIQKAEIVSVYWRAKVPDNVMGEKSLA